MTPDLYDRLGVRKLINAHGTLTRLGGTLLAPAVTQAMHQAAQHWIDLPDLLERSGEHVAQLLGVEAALITSGAAAGLALCAAACLTGDDPALVQQLPHKLPARRRIVLPKNHRNGYDQGLRQSGAELVEFGWIKETEPWQLEAALDEYTAAVAYFMEFADQGSLPLGDVIRLAHGRGLPVIVDAAAEIPPLANLRRFTAEGADLVVFSGGKDIGGPQSSGLITGRRSLIARCRLNSSPNYSLGRSMKVGKEEIAGFVVALEAYLAQDEAAEMASWETVVYTLVTHLNATPGVCAQRVMLSGPGIRPVTIPRVSVSWDLPALRLTPAEAARRLWTGDPAIAVGHSATGLLLNPQTLRPGEELIVAERLAALLARPGNSA
jgi:L-seryl-tRNA(Ser) seleniumtransferase